MNKKTSLLFEPLTVRSVTFNNRIGVSPMCMYSSQDGYANNWHLVHLGSRAVGGAGLILSEATAISPEGRITPNDLGIWKDEHVEGLKNITDFLNDQGSVPGIQLAHAGRKASTSSPWKGGELLEPGKGGWQPVAPSSVAFYQGNPLPEALDLKGITEVISNFKDAARRSLRAGFKVIEIHAAHGYLLHQFLSPLSNQRSDQYGGSFENRTRLVLEVVRAVREVWPEELPLFIRISATDWADGGWNPEESVALARLLAKEKVDVVDCSSGGLIPHVKIPVKQGYQVPFSAKIKNESQILTAAVGLITNSREAEEILRNEEADFVFLGREFLRDPYFPLKAAEDLQIANIWPDQYLRAKLSR